MAAIVEKFPMGYPVDYPEDYPKPYSVFGFRFRPVSAFSQALHYIQTYPGAHSFCGAESGITFIHHDCRKRDFYVGLNKAIARDYISLYENSKEAQNLRQAIIYLDRAVQDGCSQARFILACLLHKYRGSELAKHPEIVDWFKQMSWHFQCLLEDECEQTVADATRYIDDNRVKLIRITVPSESAAAYGLEKSVGHFKSKSGRKIPETKRQLSYAAKKPRSKHKAGSGRDLNSWLRYEDSVLRKVLKRYTRSDAEVNSRMLRLVRIQLCWSEIARCYLGEQAPKARVANDLLYVKFLPKLFDYGATYKGEKIHHLAMSVLFKIWSGDDDGHRTNYVYQIIDGMICFLPIDVDAVADDVTAILRGEGNDPMVQIIEREYYSVNNNCKCIYRPQAEGPGKFTRVEYQNFPQPQKDFRPRRRIFTGQDPKVRAAAKMLKVDDGFNSEKHYGAVKLFVFADMFKIIVEAAIDNKYDWYNTCWLIDRNTTELRQAVEHSFEFNTFINDSPIEIVMSMLVGVWQFYQDNPRYLQHPQMTVALACQSVLERFDRLLEAGLRASDRETAQTFINHLLAEPGATDQQLFCDQLTVTAKFLADHQLQVESQVCLRRCQLLAADVIKISDNFVNLERYLKDLPVMAELAQLKKDVLSFAIQSKGSACFSLLNQELAGCQRSLYNELEKTCSAEVDWPLVEESSIKAKVDAYRLRFLRSQNLAPFKQCIDDLAQSVFDNVWFARCFLPDKVWLLRDVSHRISALMRSPADDGVYNSELIDLVGESHFILSQRRHNILDWLSRPFIEIFSQQPHDRTRLAGPDSFRDWGSRTLFTGVANMAAQDKRSSLLGQGGQAIVVDGVAVRNLSMLKSLRVRQ